MDESEKLFQELQRLESTRVDIQKEKVEALQDPGLRENFSSMLLAERVLDPNDPDLRDLRAQLETRKDELHRKEKTYRVQHQRLCGELFELSRPVTQKVISKFNRMTGELELRREILGKKYDGVNRRTILNVSSNERAVRLARVKIAEAIKEIQSMTLHPISTILEASERLEKEIRGIDLRRMERFEVDENEYYRGQPPQGVGDFTGPRSGLQK